jgi:hypothetical protein
MPKSKSQQRREKIQRKAAPAGELVGRKAVLVIAGEKVEGEVSRVNPDGTVSIRSGEFFFHRVRPEECTIEAPAKGGKA